MALSASFNMDAVKDTTKPKKDNATSGRRKQLHILYLMNDILHHSKFHADPSLAYHAFIGRIQPYLVDLLGYAGAYSTDEYPNQQRKLQALLGIWEDSCYYETPIIDTLREAVVTAANEGYPKSRKSPAQDTGASDNTAFDDRRDALYVMPSSHGDASSPYYDLPAGNMLPHIMPDSNTPINPQLLKPLQFVTGPAEDSLATAVQVFLENVKSLDDAGYKVEDKSVDVNELGQPMLRDGVTGLCLGGEGYYGWSRTFCEKIKRTRKGNGNTKDLQGRNTSMERSSSPRKRRKYKEDDHSDRSGRSMSLGSNVGKRHKGGHRSSSGSASSFSEARQYRSLRSRSQSISRSPSYSPPPLPINDAQLPVDLLSPSPASLQSTQQTVPALPGQFLYPLHKSVPPLGPDGYPIPPPRPHNYQGQWPPPPPPPTFTASAPPFPTGPRLHATSPYSQGVTSNLQNQGPQTAPGWGPSLQMLSDNIGNHPYAGRGRMQASYKTDAKNNSGPRPGGWARQ